MKLQERSYSSKILRPKPAIHFEDDGSLIVITTSWGQPEHANLAQEEIVKYITAAKSDVEVTSPFDFMTCLTDEVNYLRIALLIANELIYRTENKSGYHAAVEALVLFQRDSQLAWAQVGQPSLFLRRRGGLLQPLSQSTDLGKEILTGFAGIPPLPSQFLGMDATCQIQCGHHHVASGDEAIVFAGASISPTLWADQSQFGLASITQQITQQDSESPFWLGLVQFE